MRVRGVMLDAAARGFTRVLYQWGFDIARRPGVVAVPSVLPFAQLAIALLQRHIQALFSS